MKTIKTVGTGELTLKPDVVRLYMTVTGVAGDYEETVRMSEERSEALRDCFSEVGFERDDLKTVGFNVNTKYENRRDGGSGDSARVFVGYEFVHELRIEFDAEREKLSCVLGAHGIFEPELGHRAAARCPSSGSNIPCATERRQRHACSTLPLPIRAQEPNGSQELRASRARFRRRRSTVRERCPSFPSAPSET